MAGIALNLHDFTGWRTRCLWSGRNNSGMVTPRSTSRASRFGYAKGLDLATRTVPLVGSPYSYDVRGSNKRTRTHDIQPRCPFLLDECARVRGILANSTSVLTSASHTTAADDSTPQKRGRFTAMDLRVTQLPIMSRVY
ncbi:hypothetical protein E2C01_028429 [Portunus trituberculatus]|uniref:Uncharacterized protein n=1 Tax=Portunus trituberculatus TaxID=210409 RepID=A0A5B7ELC5_PORTR|nr:hypothetical protein [Portunus trituberculatus]